MTTYTETIADSVTVGEVIAKEVDKELTDAVSLADTIVKESEKQMSDWVSAQDNLETIGREIIKSDTVTLADTIQKEVDKTLTDSVSLSETIVKEAVKTYDDGIDVSDVIMKEAEIIKADIVSVLDSAPKEVERVLADAITVSDIVPALGESKLTVVGGSGSGLYRSGEEVSIVANDFFVYWKGTDVAFIVDTQKKTTTIVMPTTATGWAISLDLGSNYNRMERLEEHDNMLFAATTLAAGGGSDGVEVYVLIDGTWSLDEQFSNGGNNRPSGLKSFNGDLYLCTQNDAKVYIRIGGVWSVDKDFSADYDDLFCLETHNDGGGECLYVGTGGNTGADIWKRTTAGVWSLSYNGVVPPGWIVGLKNHSDGYLYAIRARGGNVHILKLDGTWSFIKTFTGTGSYTSSGAIESHGGYLFLDASRTASSRQVHKFDGSDWTEVWDVSSRTPNNLLSYSGGLYLCTYLGRIYIYGDDNFTEIEDLYTDDGYLQAYWMESHKNELYVGLGSGAGKADIFKARPITGLVSIEAVYAARKTRGQFIEGLDMTTKAGKYDLVIEQGSTFERKLYWKDEDGNAIDLTSYSAIMDIRDKKDDANVIITLSTGNNRITLGGAAGTIILTIADADTDDLDFDWAFYDLELKNSSNKKVRLIQGRVKLSKEVTRSA